MKNFLIVLFVLILVGVGGYFGWRYYNQSQANVSPDLNKKANSFVWGVTARPHAINKYNAKDWAKMVGYAKDLGVNYVRLSWETDTRDPKFNDKVISEVEKQGMGIYLAIGGDSEIQNSDNPYQTGYDSAYQIASQFKGRIKYYQLSNEISAAALKGSNFNGDKESDYYPEKYAKIRDWLKGANAGVKKADPSAKTVVTGMWIQYYIFNMLQNDKVDFDYIGWDWYSDMELIQDNKLSDGEGILDKLKALGKPVMLTEVSQRPDIVENEQILDEDKQSQYIADTVNWAYESGFIKGVIVYELIDEIPVSLKTQIEAYGLVEAKRLSSGKGAIVGLRKAYTTYKDIIAKHNQ